MASRIASLKPIYIPSPFIVSYLQFSTSSSSVLGLESLEVSVGLEKLNETHYDLIFCVFFDLFSF